jgi:hypothetical protein
MKSSARSLVGAIATASVFLSLGGCASSGFGKSTRDDVEAQMTAAQPKLVACYGEALKRNRKAEGTVTVSFVAKAKTGKFEDIKVVRSGMSDPELDKCVIAELGTLALSKPTKSHVAVEYPVSFTASEK